MRLDAAVLDWAVRRSVRVHARMFFGVGAGDGFTSNLPGNNVRRLTDTGDTFFARWSTDLAAPRLLAAMSRKVHTQ